MNISVKLLSAGFGLTLAALYAVAADVAPITTPIALNTESAPAAEAAAVAVPTLSPLEVHRSTSLTVLEQLRHNHYVRKPLDDGISSEVFDKYLDALDGGRAYFLASDIQAFEQYRYELDDALKRGNLKPAFEIFNRYQTRVVERLQYLLNQIELGLDTIDFSVDEQLEIDRENASWPASLAAQNDHWRKRLKAAVLGMLLNEKELPEIAELLTKRYKNRLKQTLQNKSEDAFQLYVNAFATTYDPHTQYFSPRTSQNFNINMSLSLEGIGAVLKNEDDYTSVVRLVPAGPADKAGDLSPSDRIVSVGQGEKGPLVDVVGWRLDDVVELIRGPKGSVVRLEIVPGESDDGVSRVIAITRNTVELEEQAAQAKLLTLDDGAHERHIGVIDIPTFYVDFKGSQQGDPNYRSTTRDVARLIEKLKDEGAEALIIDLRNNGGGSLQEADTLTGLFIETGPTVQVKSARRRANIYSDVDDLVAWDGPLAVMVNRLSASASEIFAGAIQDYGRGLIIGSQTFGKGTVQTLIPLNRGQLKITAAKFYRVSGQSTQHQGVLPDIAFPELFDINEVGESALDDAMPWDMIQPAIYDQNTDIQPLLATLRKNHDARVADSADFNYFKAYAAKAQENAHRTHLSLNKAKRLAEKATDDQWRLDLENTLRAAKGKPIATNLDHLEELEEAEQKEAEQKEAEQKVSAAISDDGDDTVQADTTMTQASTETIEEDIIELVKDDAMIEEAGMILLDLIGLSMQVAQLESVSTGMGNDVPETVNALDHARTDG